MPGDLLLPDEFLGLINSSKLRPPGDSSGYLDGESFCLAVCDTEASYVVSLCVCDGLGIEKGFFQVLGRDVRLPHANISWAIFPTKSKLCLNCGHWPYVTICLN